MNNLKTYNEFILINEKFDFFKYKDKILNLLNKKVNSLNKKEKEKLKDELFQYKNMSLNKIKSSLISNFTINNKTDVDPYGEEIWDEDKERIQDIRIERRLGKKTKILKFLGILGINSISCSIAFVIFKNIPFFNSSLSDTEWGYAIILGIIGIMAGIIHLLVDKFYRIN